MGPSVEMDQTLENVGGSGAAANANFYFPTFYVGCEPRERRGDGRGGLRETPSSTVASDALLDRLFETARAPEPMARDAPEPMKITKKPSLLVVVRKSAFPLTGTTRKVMKRRRGPNQTRGNKRKRRMKMKKSPKKTKKGKTENKTKNGNKTKRLRQSRSQN